MGPKIKVPVTIFVRLDEVEKGITSGIIRGHLELYTTEEASAVTIEGNKVPLEFEQSSALAYTFEGSDVYKFELKGLLSGDFSLPIKNVARFRDDLFFMAPYLPGRIPVVLVHGTASSPARWAEMLKNCRMTAPCGDGISSGCLPTTQEILLPIPAACWPRPCAVWSQSMTLREKTLHSKRWW